MSYIRPQVNLSLTRVTTRHKAVTIDGSQNLTSSVGESPASSVPQPGEMELDRNDVRKKLS